MSQSESAQSGSKRQSGLDDVIGRAGTPAQTRALRTRGKRTLEKLLNAGLEVFSERGYHAARVDDVVHVAQTSHGTFYLYFSNKEDLFYAIVADVAERLMRLTQELEPIGPDEAGRKILEEWIRSFCDLYATYGAVIRTWTEAESEDSEIGQVGASVLTRLAGAFAEHIDHDHAPKPKLDKTTAALALVAMVERSNYFVDSGQVGADRDRVVKTLTSVTHAGLFGN